ncbi:MAG: cob(I)yrinic acid a,c-diamide adenosyltransferase [Paludibacter sp.]
MKLYTKTGDNGETGLIGGTRVPKNDVRLEAYGTVDELNTFIGLLTTCEIPNEDLSFIRTIQRNLFNVGANLATDREKVELNPDSIIKSENIEQIEQEIDRITANLPELQNFILPGGSKSGALCHVCRTISRRAERRLFEMNVLYRVDKQTLIYLNRLSDYFFALSRYFTRLSGVEEICWKTHD